MNGFGKRGSGKRSENARKTAAKGKRSKTESPQKGSSGEPSVADRFLRITEAEVAAVESHPKQPGMYRIAIRLLGELKPDHSDEFEPNFSIPPASNTEDWNDEVDALIAGASAASAADRHETVITVHEDTLVSMRLLKGRRLSPEEWETLRKEEAQEEAYRAALNILERKARTSRELSDALKRKGFAADVIQSCLDRLRSRRMLDDTAYAKRYTEQRATGQRKGRRLIRQELLQRGIAKEDADRALGDLDTDVELEAAYALARKKWPQLKGELRERKMKLTAFLMRRGYPNGVVRSAMDRAIADASDSEERGWGIGYDGEDGDMGSLDWEMNEAADPDALD
ncbi:regulatory protein RecX [Cohnella candidum]|uniref:Regulatory protein RecX n=1 Tax=Cohnella candidum TaxID=2674991 RepID=A0A3G3JUZ0_9BACL|nr:regulatory protein RecX [Cohnella candidum]AYQ72052.1 regulatory protein RecX [Cohnella candidum]